MARLVLSFNNFRPIGVDAESLLHFDFENPGAVDGAGGRRNGWDWWSTQNERSRR
jgi:hypothetical protein